MSTDWFNSPITPKMVVYTVCGFIVAEVVISLVYWVVTTLWDRRQ